MFWTKRNMRENRLQVYRFLIDAAGDGMVAPTILPGSQKLGEERSSLYLEAVEGEGVLMDEYRSRKLLWTGIWSRWQASLIFTFRRYGYCCI